MTFLPHQTFALHTYIVYPFYIYQLLMLMIHFLTMDSDTDTYMYLWLFSRSHPNNQPSSQFLLLQFSIFGNKPTYRS